MRENAYLDDTGFTLIELLVAIVIMTIGLLGLFQMINYAYSYNLVTIFRNEAVMIGDEQMITEKAKLFDNISTNGIALPHRDSINRNLRNAFKNYSVTKVGDAVGNSKQVTITVSWKYKNASYSHNVSSVITK